MAVASLVLGIIALIGGLIITLVIGGAIFGAVAAAI